MPTRSRVSPCVPGSRVHDAALGSGVVVRLVRGGRLAVVRFEGRALPVEVPVRRLTVETVPETAPATPAPKPAAAPPQTPVSPPAPAPAAVPALAAVAAPLAAPAPAPAAPTTPGPKRKSTPASKPSPTAAAPTRPSLDRAPALDRTVEHRIAARTVEAMRLGVVPDDDLESYTVGRGAELSLIEHDLDTADQQGGAVRAFLGDYGAGKTHLLELVQRHALARGFLTARATLDPTEVPPSHPKRVYRARVRSLRYPDRSTEEDAGLRPLIARAAADPAALQAAGVHVSPGLTPDDALAAGRHLYLAPALAYAKTLGGPDLAGRIRGVGPAETESAVEACWDLLMDWLEGHPTLATQDIDTQLARLPGAHPRVYSLMDYRPWSRIYGYLLSGLSAAARAVGYRGLVVLLDEAEFYALLSAENRSFARHLFKAWAFAAVGAAGGALPFDAEELDIGGYGVLQRLPARFGAHPGLYVVLAMTPSKDGLDALRSAVPEAWIHEIRTLDGADYLALSERICAFYASSREDWTLPAPLVGPLGKVLGGLIDAGYVTSPRQAMKFLIELLDVVRCHPDAMRTVITGLQRTLAG